MRRPKSLESSVRRIENLYRAWTVVRGNVNASGHARFKAEVKTISENPFPYLRRIQTQLQRRKFVFAQQHGVLKHKAPGKKRPIIVSPIENRVVQRAILNILQADQDPITSMLGEVTTLIRTPTSVGGIPQRGVSYGIDLLRAAIKNGATHYLRSDIKDFFTKIPKGKFINIVKCQTHDDQFSRLLSQALETELDNIDELKDFIHLFPLGDVGVPQGSSLSAIAGNIVLRNFDEKMNRQGVTTIRYIDDFVIVGSSEWAIR